MSEIKEACGVFGIYANDQAQDVATSAYYGLYALQHRGQESCGIVVNDDGVFHTHLDTGMVCAVFNAASCKAIHDAVYLGMPLVRRIVTVSGDIVMEPKNLLVPIGTSFNDLLEAVGHSENPYKVLSGGPMMGVTQYDLSVPTIKGTNAVTILGRGNRFVVEESACIRGGKCIDACPMKLMPVLMYKALYSGSVEEMKGTHMMDCIECGSCAYTCPASVPLVMAFRSGKQQIRSAMAAAAKK